MHFHVIGDLEGPAEIAVIALLTAITYFLGNINPAAIQARAHGLNIKEKGSGNAGTTNITRVLGIKAGIITLVIDILKGAAAVFFGRYTAGEDFAMLCAFAVFVGHVWPVVYKFKGGKGVATAFGALTALEPGMGLTALLLVVLGVISTQRMSGGSIVGAVTFPFVVWFFKPEFLPIGIILAIIVFFKHWSNIVRMAKGEEPKLSFRKSKEKK